MCTIANPPTDQPKRKPNASLVHEVDHEAQLKYAEGTEVARINL
jgi:hypothetical protein